MSRMRVCIDPLDAKRLFGSLDPTPRLESSMSLRNIFLPREKVFFELLEKESHNVMLGAQAFRDLILNYEHLQQKRDQVKDIEHQGDDIVHQIYEQLMKTFVTPIDREEIAQLASLYDDVLDYTYAVVNRLYLYEIAKPTETMRRFADLIPKAVQEIDFAFAAIHEIKAPGIEARCNEVDRLENEADDLMNESVAALFKSHDAITIMKLKEIYELMETITDKCEDVVQLIRNIILEYS
jgi:predicted phosphate transport protein (TIGR00153 family)